MLNERAPTPINLSGFCDWEPGYQIKLHVHNNPGTFTAQTVFVVLCLRCCKMLRAYQATIPDHLGQYEFYSDERKRSIRDAVNACILQHKIEKHGHVDANAQSGDIEIGRND
jgi:hypothetical protein